MPFSFNGAASSHLLLLIFFLSHLLFFYTPSMRSRLSISPSQPPQISHPTFSLTRGRPIFVFASPLFTYSLIKPFTTSLPSSHTSPSISPNFLTKYAFRSSPFPLTKSPFRVDIVSVRERGSPPWALLSSSRIFLKNTYPRSQIHKTQAVKKIPNLCFRVFNRGTSEVLTNRCSKIPVFMLGVHRIKVSVSNLQDFSPFLPTFLPILSPHRNSTNLEILTSVRLFSNSPTISELTMSSSDPAELLSSRNTELITVVDELMVALARAFDRTPTGIRLTPVRISKNA